MLARIHRSNDGRWWTESCLRLRDFVMSYEGAYEVWRRHDLDRGHLSVEQQKYFQTEAVWLCTRCEDIGRENGKQFAHTAARRSFHEGVKHLRSMTATRPASLRSTVRGPFTFLEHT